MDAKQDVALVAHKAMLRANWGAARVVLEDLGAMNFAARRTVKLHHISWYERMSGSTMPAPMRSSFGDRLRPFLRPDSFA